MKINFYYCILENNKLMKNQFKTLVLLFLGLVVAPANTKAQMLELRSNIISLGYGFPKNYNQQYSFLYSYDSNIKSTGAFYLKYEHFISTNFSIGATANFMKLSAVDDVPVYMTDSLGYYSIDYYTKRTISSFRSSFLFRFNSHYELSDRFDAFWGLGLGFRKANEKITTSSSVTISSHYHTYLGLPLAICLEGSVGLRYKCNEKIMLYTELGLGQSYFQLGVATKL